MDLNADGIGDMITGEYWPGDIYVFWGQSDGTYTEKEYLTHEDESNLNAGGKWENEQQPNMKSLAAAPYATDWDDDGDLDMLIGNIEGSVTLIMNVGDRSDPIFSDDRVVLEADGKQLSVRGDSGPVFEDWDHDGLRDLLVGGGDGAVTWYKNVGSKTAPEFAAGAELINAAGHGNYEHGALPPRPGTRVKLCVTDYNDDGLVDLMIGDYISEAGPELELTSEQEKRRDELQKQMSDYSAKMQKVYEEFQEGIEGLSEAEVAKATEEFQEKMSEEGGDFSEIYSELGELQPRTISHGFVWFFERLPVSTEVESNQDMAERAEQPAPNATSSVSP